MEFLRSFLKRHLAGKPVVTSPNVAACKKVLSDSLGLVDFALRLVNSVFNLPNGQACFLRNLNNRRTVTSTLLVKKFFGLVKMMSGLVNASFSLPEWQAVKVIFFAPCVGGFLGLKLRKKKSLTHTVTESSQSSQIKSIFI